MSDPNFPDLTDRIGGCVQEICPGARLVRTWPLVGGISAQTTAFEIVTAAGQSRKLVARMPGPWTIAEDPLAAAHHFALLQVLASTDIPSPLPVFLEAHECPFLVVEYLEGAPFLNPSDPIRYAEAFADQLAAIHAVRLPQGAEDHISNVNVLRTRPETPNAELREGEIWDALDHMGAPRANPAVFRHGDFWPGNVLWRDGRISGVIDWEEANIGEPLADVACSRLDLLWILGPEGSDAFTRRYLARFPVDPRSLPYWDLRAALRPMGYLPEWAGPFPALGRPDVTYETMRDGLFWFIGQALAR